MGDEVRDGYYWVRHPGPDCPNTTWIALREDGLWFAPGIEGPMNANFSAAEIIGPVPRLDH